MKCLPEAGVFTLFEYAVDGCLHGHGLGGGIHESMGNRYEVLARTLVVFLAFRELEWVLGNSRQITYQELHVCDSEEMVVLVV